MYAAWCLRRADGCGVAAFGDLKARARQAALAGRCSRRPTSTSVFDAPLDVVWGSRPDPDYLAMTQAVTGQPAPCRGAGAGWIDAARRAAGGPARPGRGRAAGVPLRADPRL